MLELAARDPSPVVERFETNLGFLDIREIVLRGNHGLADRLDVFGGSRATAALAQHQLHEEPIDVVATQMRVAVGGEHLEHAIFDLEDRDVERAAAKVVDRDDAAIAAIEAVGERCGCRLVHDAQHFEPGQPAGVARRRSLRVVEIGGHGDDGAIDFEIELTLLAEMIFRALFQFAKHERRDLRRRELTIVQPDADDASGFTANPERQQFRFVSDVINAAAHESLDRVDAPRRSRQQTSLRLAAHEEGPILAERHDRRHERIARRVANHLRHAVAHVRDEAVRRPEIDSYDITHGSRLSAPGSGPRDRWRPTGC